MPKTSSFKYRTLEHVEDDENIALIDSSENKTKKINIKISRPSKNIYRVEVNIFFLT
jgi:hypothetical protein